MRLRYNNAAGALGSPALTSTATTITFAAAPPFATLVSPNFIPLVLDPPAGPSPNVNFEVVYLTAYTSGATTGTILRGQEGTTGVAHNIGATWAQAPTQLDLNGQPPVGSIVPYTGSGDPPETNWLIADGRLIDKTVYADFFARTGHVYNALGADPGSNKVRIPDKRGVHSIGASNMGSAAGACSVDNSHVNTVNSVSNTRGTLIGEAAHTITAAEVAGHSHGITEPASGTGHKHGYTEPVTGGHAHGLTGAPTVGPTDVGNVRVNLGSTYNIPWSNSSGFSSGSASTSYVPTGIDISRTTTGISINASVGGDGPHNNVPPAQADSYIVRVA